MLNFSIVSMLLFFSFLAVASLSNLEIYQDELLKDIEVLASDKMAGRRTGSEGNRLAREYLIRRLVEIGVPPFLGPGLHGYEQPFDYFYNNGSADIGPIPGVNVVSVVHGKIDMNIIVLSAHYDHLGVDNQNRIYNGADDNASGSAGLLQLAEYFACKQPHNTLIFVHFDAEESNFDRKIGLHIQGKTDGAQHFVNNSPSSLDMIKLNINLDMISHDDKSELHAIVMDSDMPKLEPFLHDSSGRVNILVHNNGGWPMRSDNDEFGIPYVYFTVNAHKDYHKPTDTYENINHTFVGHTVQAILDITRKLDQALANGHLAF